MNHLRPEHLDETREIVAAVHRIHTDPELRAAVHSDPNGVLDRLGLRGSARDAVSSVLGASLAAAAVIQPMGFWSS